MEIVWSSNHFHRLAFWLVTQREEHLTDTDIKQDTKEAHNIRLMLVSDKKFKGIFVNMCECGVNEREREQKVQSSLARNHQSALVNEYILS